MNAYKTHTISTVVFDRLFVKYGIPSSIISDVESDQRPSQPQDEQLRPRFGRQAVAAGGNASIAGPKLNSAATLRESDQQNPAVVAGWRPAAAMGFTWRFGV